MFEKLKNLFKKKKPVVKSAKDLATERGEPWVQVVKLEIDNDNPEDGAFELDFNEIFVARLVKAGFVGKTDAEIVDQWFQQVCRNVAMENFEQWQANHPEFRE